MTSVQSTSVELARKLLANQPNGLSADTLVDALVKQGHSEEYAKASVRDGLQCGALIVRDHLKIFQNTKPNTECQEKANMDDGYITTLRDLLWRVIRDVGSDRDAPVSTSTLSDIIVAVGLPPSAPSINEGSGVPDHDVMKCPECKTVLNPKEDYHEGEDEKSDGLLYWYAEWQCPECGQRVSDYEDAFRFVTNGVLHPDES